MYATNVESDIEKLQKRNAMVRKTMKNEPVPTTPKRYFGQGAIQSALRMFRRK